MNIKEFEDKFNNTKGIVRILFNGLSDDNYVVADDYNFTKRDDFSYYGSDFILLAINDSGFGQFKLEDIRDVISDDDCEVIGDDD